MAILPEPPPAHFVPAPERQVAARQVLRALQALSVEDRVALKLAEAPEALDPDELDWLAARIDSTRDEARARALRADKPRSAVLLYEPAPAAADKLQGDGDRPLSQAVSRARQRSLALLRGER
nr:hypothetical protein [Deltaproteobacteria bacterium]